MEYQRHEGNQLELLRISNPRIFYRIFNGPKKKADTTLRYSMYNDHISYLEHGWWDFYKHGIILKGISNKNNKP
jgi:hypothetical protein